MNSKDTPASTDNDDKTVPQQPTLARKIAGWTTNGIAIALVLMTGLAVGRQTINWWHDSRATVEPPADVAGDAQLGDASKLHAFEFGELPGAFGMRSFSGDESAALAELALLCRRVLASPEHVWQPPTPAARKLLESTARLKPVAADAGNWEVHQLSGPLLLSVGIKHLKTGRDEERERCIVCWGIAAPVLDAKGEPTEQYSLYVYSPQAPQAGAGSPLSELTWPAFLQPSLAIHSPGGDTVVGLTSTADLQRCMEFFDRTFAARDFIRPAPWSQGPDGQLAARFKHASRGDVKVQLSRSESGEVQGMAWYIAAQPASASP